MAPADIIDARYRLERLLGTGGMSDVWLAEDQRLGRWVAVKLLRQDDATGAFATSLEREARVIARLQHPNIVQVYDAGSSAGRPYLVMEYVHGMSLRELLAHRGRMTEAEALSYAGQVALALEYAHGQGVIHCDIKPENILVTEQGVAKAVDFGIAETATQTLGPEEARAVLGTIAYLAPEVVQGAQPDVRSDVYSLALVTYEMVAGRQPFAGANPAALAGQRIVSTAPALRSFVPAASLALEAALARALAIQPAQRFASAALFAEALGRVGLGMPAVVTRPPRAASPAPGVLVPRSGTAVRRNDTARLRRQRAASRSNAAIIVALGGLVALLVGAAATALILSRGDEAPSVTDPTVSPTVVATSTRPPTPSPVANATATATPTATPTPRPSPSPSATASATPTATRTTTPPPTASTTVTATPVASPTPTTPAGR